jgi:hypothetical protein
MNVPELICKNLPSQINFEWTKENDNFILKISLPVIDIREFPLNFNKLPTSIDHYINFKEIPKSSIHFKNIVTKHIIDLYSHEILEQFSSNNKWIDPHLNDKNSNITKLQNSNDIIEIINCISIYLKIKETKIKRIFLEKQGSHHSIRLIKRFLDQIGREDLIEKYELDNEQNFKKDIK